MTGPLGRCLSDDVEERPICHGCCCPPDARLVPNGGPRWTTGTEWSVLVLADETGLLLPGKVEFTMRRDRAAGR